MMKSNYPYYLSNKAHQPNTDLSVTDKYAGEVATRVALTDSRAIEEAIADNSRKHSAPLISQQWFQHVAQIAFPGGIGADNGLPV